MKKLNLMYYSFNIKETKEYINELIETINELYFMIEYQATQHIKTIETLKNTKKHKKPSKKDNKEIEKWIPLI